MAVGAREVQGALRPRVSFSLQPHGLCRQPTPSLAHLLPHRVPVPLRARGPLLPHCPRALAPRPRGGTRAPFSSRLRLPPPYPELPTARPHAPGGQQAAQAPQPHRGPGEVGMGSEPGRAASWAFRQRQLGSVQAWLCPMLSQRRLTSAELVPASKALSQTPHVTVRPPY